MRVTNGVCAVLYACDLGQRMDLAACRAGVQVATARRTRPLAWIVLVLLAAEIARPLFGRLR